MRLRGLVSAGAGAFPADVAANHADPVRCAVHAKIAAPRRCRYDGRAPHNAVMGKPPVRLGKCVQSTSG